MMLMDIGNVYRVHLCCPHLYLRSRAALVERHKVKVRVCDDLQCGECVYVCLFELYPLLYSLLNLRIDTAWQNIKHRTKNTTSSPPSTQLYRPIQRSVLKKKSKNKKTQRIYHSRIKWHIRLFRLFTHTYFHYPHPYHTPSKLIYSILTLSKLLNPISSLSSF